MLTIKHVSPTGAHSIYQSHECSYAPTFPDQEFAREMGQLGFVWYKDGNEIKSLEDGTVYVMNDAGSTVAKYELRGEPFVSAAVVTPGAGLAFGAVGVKTA